jgi:hypothetical protein
MVAMDMERAKIHLLGMLSQKKMSLNLLTSWKIVVDLKSVKEVGFYD